MRILKNFDRAILPKLVFGWLSIYASHACAQTNLTGIPTKEQVGASNLPAQIAPIHAPFAMPDFKRPVFPDRSITLEKRNVKPGTLSTRIIQNAIDKINKKGGGTVIVPAGTWNTGRISLKSNVNLHLQEGAELLFSGRVEDYYPAVFTRNEGVEVMSLGGLHLCERTRKYCHNW